MGLVGFDYGGKGRGENSSLVKRWRSHKPEAGAESVRESNLAGKVNFAPGRGGEGKCKADCNWGKGRKMGSPILFSHLR